MVVCDYTPGKSSPAPDGLRIHHSPKTAKAADKEGIAAFLNPAEMHKLGRLVLLSRYTVEGNLAGAHRSPLRGPSSEFADHKSYGAGR